jgi:type II secretory pathway pseudopilin PulG
VQAAALALVVLTLLAVVTLAASGGHPNGHGRTSDREVPTSIQDALVTLLAIGYVLTIAGLIYWFFRHRGQWQPRKRSNWIRNFILVLILMAVIVPFGYRALTDQRLKERAQRAQQQQRAQQEAQRRLRDKPLKPVPGRTAEFNWWIAGGVGGLLLIGGAWLLVRRRPLSPLPEGESVAEALSDIAAASIDDLRREGDPRRAVIAAYANMERVLAQHGLPRRRAEAPFEYLGRILRQLEVSESSVHRLTELFEYAKFSTHEIDAGMKDQAIEAFAALRDELQAEEAVAA